MVDKIFGAIFEFFGWVVTFILIVVMVSIVLLIGIGIVIILMDVVAALFKLFQYLT